MIDVENLIFTKIYNAVHEAFPKAKIYGETVEQIASFPAVTIQEINNVSLRRTIGTDNEDNHATVTYEVNVYDDSKTANKQKCKEIMSIVDKVFMDYGFYRIMVARLPNQDRTVFRIYGRWRAIVEKGITEGDDTIFYTYRQ